MQLAQWNPFREMDDLLARFGRGFGRPALASEDWARLPLANWAPAVDISETDSAYQIRAELPGMKKDEIKLTVDQGVLTLSGERKVETQDKDQKHHRIERSFGSFTRSFVLPPDAVADGISAECKDGVLTVRIARTPAAAPKSIDVKIA